ncbi:MAG: HAD family hydrolase [Fimbriiglobus sp.]
MPALLFDIDGTLIRTGGAGKAAMEGAMRLAFGLSEVLDNVPYSGRTDPAIGHDLLVENRIDPTPENLARLHATYLEVLPQRLHEIGGEVCVGVRELLAELEREPAIVLGLLTGNMRHGAQVKLSHFGLWDTFALGGFGDRHTDRDDVAREAQANLHEHLGRRLPAEEIWIIGDTPLDVKCAKAIGVKSIAVATGWHPREELDATGADLVLDDLRDTAALLELWR